MKQDVQQRSIAEAVEFLRAHGPDPALWSSAERGRRTRKVPRRQRQLDRLAAETVRDWGGATIPR